MGGRGSGGRNRKPTARKKVEGNAGHRRLNEKEPKPPLGEPARPAYLTPKARSIWRELVPLLLDMKVLHRSDGQALAMVCTSIATVIQAEKAIEKFGLVCATVDEETGVAVLKANPAVRIRSDSMRHARAGLSNFGLDPASRSRIIADLEVGREQDPLEKFLAEESQGPVQ